LAEGERIDPNRADEVELDRLPGIGPSVAQAIVAAREDGLGFRTPEDLLAVRGVGPATLERIRPALDLTRAPSVARVAPNGAERRLGARPVPVLVDVNHADLTELQTLPGIGPAIAERMLVARREQVFTSLDDLIRVRGIGPATVERLRPHATVGRGP
jgi:competence protein ComEA